MKLDDQSSSQGKKGQQFEMFKQATWTNIHQTVCHIQQLACEGFLLQIKTDRRQTWKSSALLFARSALFPARAITIFGLACLWSSFTQFFARTNDSWQTKQGGRGGCVTQSVKITIRSMWWGDEDSWNRPTCLQRLSYEACWYISCNWARLFFFFFF